MSELQPLYDRVKILQFKERLVEQSKPESEIPQILETLKQSQLNIGEVVCNAWVRKQVVTEIGIVITALKNLDKITDPGHYTRLINERSSYLAQHVKKGEATTKLIMALNKASNILNGL